MQNKSRTPQDNQVSQLENEIARLNKKITKYETLELKQNRFGLVWLDVPEAFEDDVENKLPILQEVPKLAINSKDGKPAHLLIEGDNYHALTCLNYTHKGKIDVIYIDPPYNTGSDGFKYKDKRILDKFPDGTEVPADHPLRHSYWLSFMSKRLQLAKGLLQEDGIIFISIGEDEIGQLKLLCNEVFGERNFITNFIWEKTQHFGRQKVNSYSNADYILCYAKQLNNAKLKELLVESVKTEHEDAPLYNASNPINTLVFPAGKVIFNIADGEYKNTTDEKYELIKKSVVKNGKNKNELVLKFRSRWSQRKVDEELGKGTTFWVKSENFAIRAIYGNGKTSNDSPKQIIFTNANNEFVAKSRFGQKVGVNEEASSELFNMIGEQNIFEYPKPRTLIEYLISLFFNHKTNEHYKNITVLDFFAGSGTTGHAVLSLNKNDQGSRNFILCTNNENNICKQVCYPRLQKAIAGYKALNDGKIEGLGGNVKYFTTAFVGKNNILTADDRDKIDLAHNAGGMLAIAENTFDQAEKTDHWQIFTSGEKYTAIYFREEFSRFDDFVERVKKLDKPATVYIFSWEKELEFNEFEANKNIAVKTIPQPILEIYKQIYNLV